MIFRQPCEAALFCGDEIDGWVDEHAVHGGQRRRLYDKNKDGLGAAQSNGQEVEVVVCDSFDFRPMELIPVPQITPRR